MKATAGNWTYGESIDSMWYVESEENPGVMLAEVMPAVSGSDETRANAILMAAAPELLTALVGAVELLEAISPLEGDVLRRARIAIDIASAA